MQTLNERQMDIGTAIRVAAPPPEGEAWGDYLDLTRAVAKIVDSGNVLVHPTEVQKSFQAAWIASSNLWLNESNRILRDCLGGQADYDRVAEHPNGKNAFKRILKRIKETHGELTAGMVTEIEVEDILLELEILEG